MLARNRADEKQTETGALDLDEVIRRRAIEALEDALEFACRNAEAGVSDGEHDIGIALNGNAALDVHTVG